MRDIIISSTTKRNKCVFCWQEKWIFSYRPYTHESIHSADLLLMMMMTKNTLFAVFCLSRSTWTWSSCDTVYHKQTHLTFNTLLNEDNSLLCVLAASWQGIFFTAANQAHKKTWNLIKWNVDGSRDFFFSFNIFPLYWSSQPPFSFIHLIKIKRLYGNRKKKYDNMQNL